MGNFDPPRKRFFGDTTIAQHYIGPATKLLDSVKGQMGYNNLAQLSRQVTLPGGVVLFAQSVFGQDEIRVYAPPRPLVGGQGAIRLPRTAVHQAVACGVLNAGGNFFWREGDGALTLLPTIGTFDTVTGISAEGDVCGGAFVGTDLVVFRWSLDAGVELLDNGPMNTAVAQCISHDGSVVAGAYARPLGDTAGTAACIWERGKDRQTLPSVPGDDFMAVIGVAGGVAAFGSSTNYRAGDSHHNDFPIVVSVWVWTPASGTQVISTLSGDSSFLTVYSGAMSADGQAVAWTESDGLGNYAGYYWTESAGKVPIYASDLNVGVTGISLAGAAVYVGNGRWTPGAGLVPVEGIESMTGFAAAGALAGEVPDPLAQVGDPPPPELEVFGGSVISPGFADLAFWRTGDAAPTLLGEQGLFVAVAINITSTGGAATGLAG
jgi:hypothetical protein